MSIIIGLECKLFRGEAGATAATEMKNVKDVTISLEKGEADITTRAADGWKVYASTLKDATIEFDMLYDPEDADTNAIANAFFGNTPLAFFVTDGEGGGLDSDVVITKFDMEQSLEEGVNVSVTARPTQIGGENNRSPKWTVASESN